MTLGVSIYTWGMLQLLLCMCLLISETLASSLRSFAPQLHHAEHQGIAGNAEQSRDADVSPPVVSFVDVHRPEVIRTCGVSTVLTRSAVVRIGDVAGIRTQEVRHVFSTRCARGQGNLCELVWPALDLNVVDNWLKEATDKVSERIEVVHL